MLIQKDYTVLFMEDNSKTITVFLKYLKIRGYLEKDNQDVDLFVTARFQSDAI